MFVYTHVHLITHSCIAMYEHTSHYGSHDQTQLEVLLYY